MRRAVAVFLVGAALATVAVPAAALKLNRPACWVAPHSAKTCSFVARSNGSVLYATQGFVKFTIKHGRTVRDVCVLGVGIGNKEPGKIYKGDAITISQITPTTTTIAIGSAGPPILHVGAQTTRPCR